MLILNDHQGYRVKSSFLLSEIVVCQILIRQVSMPAPIFFRIWKMAWMPSDDPSALSLVVEAPRIVIENPLYPMLSSRRYETPGHICRYLDTCSIGRVATLSID